MNTNAGSLDASLNATVSALTAIGRSGYQEHMTMVDGMIGRGARRDLWIRVLLASINETHDD